MRNNFVQLLLISANLYGWLLGDKSTLVFVSDKGHDSNECGSKLYDSCETLQQALVRISNLNVTSATIIIQGPSSVPYSLVPWEGLWPRLLDHLNIEGLDYKCKLSCGQLFTADQVQEPGHEVHQETDESIASEDKMSAHKDTLMNCSYLGTVSLYLSNLEISNCPIYLRNCKLQLKNVDLINAPMVSEDESIWQEIYIRNSKVKRQQACPDENLAECHYDFNSRIKSRQFIGSFNNVNFINTGINLDISESCKFDIRNSLFSKNSHYETGAGGVYLSLPYVGGQVSVTNSSFLNLRHVNPVHSAINIETAALRIEIESSKLGNQKADSEINVHGCTFTNNERALSVSRHFARAWISRCLFSRNTGMHSASAVRIAGSVTSVVVVSDSVFLHNEAGTNNHPTIKGRFEVDGDSVRINTKWINGVISLVGKGGAVRIHRGDVSFHRCTFRNNTARLLGGTLCIERQCKVSLTDCIIENSYNGLLSNQGDIIYSSGSVQLTRVVMSVMSSRNHISMLSHSGRHWSMDVTSLEFVCPRGHHLMIINTTSHRIKTQYGLMRSHKLDQMYYYCQTCANRLYSLDRGTLRYSLVHRNSSEYFTLLINGQKPYDKHPVNYVYTNITCHECPYGGDCIKGIKSVANFWGYKINNRVRFQYCPIGYCCSNRVCPSIDRCSNKRTGRLCGRCMTGYSESLFSGKCIQDSECNGVWVIPMMITSAMLYTAFLIFQRDLRKRVSPLSDIKIAGHVTTLALTSALHIPNFQSGSCEQHLNNLGQQQHHPAPVERQTDRHYLHPSTGQRTPIVNVHHELTQQSSARACLRDIRQDNEAEGKEVASIEDEIQSTSSLVPRVYITNPPRSAVKESPFLGIEDFEREESAEVYQESPQQENVDPYLQGGSDQQRLIFQTDNRRVYSLGNSNQMKQANQVSGDDEDNEYIELMGIPSRDDHSSSKESVQRIQREAKEILIRDNGSRKPEEDVEIGSSTLIIMFYYFQDGLLLHVQSAYTNNAEHKHKRLKSFLAGLFRFQLDIYHFFDDVCLIPGITSVHKPLIDVINVIFVWSLFGFLYLCNRIYLHFRKNNNRNHGGSIFQRRLSTGFVLALLFTYQKLATAMFALLNCVQVGEERVLLIDGTLACFQVWQYQVIAYVVTAVIPFSIVLMTAPQLMRSASIAPRQFFVGCLLPLPMLIYWFYKYKYKKTSLEGSVIRQPSIEAIAILSILQGPFKEHKHRLLPCNICWTGVLVARRLFLFGCFTFINDVLLRLLSMLCICFLILMQHMHVKPYKSERANMAGNLSAAALFIIGSINLLRSSFEAAEYVPVGPNAMLLNICDGVETTLILWLPLTGVSFAGLVCCIRLVAYACRGMKRKL